MTAQPDGNVRPIRRLTPAEQALTEALNRPAEGLLDAILRDEAAKPHDPKKEALQALIAKGDAVDISRAVWPEGLVAHLLDSLRVAKAERDQAARVSVALEQQVGEVECLARKWAGMKSGQVSGIGHVLLDILHGDRNYDPAA